MENMSLQIYFSQIKAFPLLSFEEELELAKRIQQGERACWQKLVESNLRLVVKIARAYMIPDIPLMDLIQEGNLGLIHAVERYDPVRCVRFSTYANWWIKQSIVRFLVNKRRIIRLPCRKEEILQKVQKSYHALTQQLARKPTAGEIAGEIGVTQKDVNSVLPMTNILSLDGDAGETGTAGILEFYEDYTYNPERALLRKDSQAAVRKLLGSLKEREKNILMYRYQFKGNKRYTLKKISAKMGISPETVRQIELRAIKKLRNNPEADFYLA
ncbi:MAG: RNA polymerase sigma factor RpoD/SigA [Treponema sp.]|jgi:RNA polymerase primary sigma factor|nr:RNA polymerase sigma factor RpoD/SigA [Treponema sp.]